MCNINSYKRELVIFLKDNTNFWRLIVVAIIGAGVFSIVIVLSILIICGLPLGELTMGDNIKSFLKN